MKSLPPPAARRRRLLATAAALPALAVLPSGWNRTESARYLQNRWEGLRYERGTLGLTILAVAGAANAAASDPAPVEALLNDSAVRWGGELTRICGLQSFCPRTHEVLIVEAVAESEALIRQALPAAGIRNALVVATLPSAGIGAFRGVRPWCQSAGVDLLLAPATPEAELQAELAGLFLPGTRQGLRRLNSDTHHKDMIRFLRASGAGYCRIAPANAPVRGRPNRSPVSELRELDAIRVFASVHEHGCDGRAVLSRMRELLDIAPAAHHFVETFGRPESPAEELLLLLWDWNTVSARHTGSLSQER